MSVGDQWRHATNLSCGHDVLEGVTGFDWREADYMKAPLRKDGWPAARSCPEGCGRRRVVSISHELVIEGRA